MSESPKVITTSHALREAVAELSRHPFVAVDTEFLRQTTYRPILCLIQMPGPGSETIIDPLSTGLDLAPFYALMANPEVVKVFHAARQDIEITYQEAGVVPKPLFDTQIAAMALGHGEAIAYGALVKKILKRNHDKTYQAVDWSTRPLSSKQLDYALGDVTHLRDMYTKLQQKLIDIGRESWLDEEVALLIDPKTYAFDPADAWKRLRLGGKTKTARGIIMALAAWRERTAQAENVPRGRVLKDEAIYEIAKHAPKSLEALSRLRSVKDSLKSRGASILQTIEDGIALAPSGSDDVPGHQDILPSASATVELLRVLLKAVSADLNIASRLLASGDDLEKLAQHDNPDIPALKGWRRELFGEKALALKNGTLALGVKNNEVTLYPL